MIKKVPKFYLKDRLFNKEKVEKFAGELSAAFHFHNVKFESENFAKDILEKFPELELKQRIFHIAENLYKYFKIANISYLESLEIIKKALPKELDDSLSDGDFGDFIYAPYGEYIARYGVAFEIENNKKYLNKSFKILEEITKRFSVEYAIREFWNNFESETFEQFLKWSKSKNYHVRRLASEGSRPRLPWGKKINLHYLQTEKILDNLVFDKTRYVTRSVANHLNDISKFDPDFVLEKLDNWEKKNKTENLQTEKEIEFINKHATRTIRKNKKGYNELK